MDEEARYLESLSPREAFHVAVEPGWEIVGVQSLDLWARAFPAMAHVGQVGTFLLARRRGQGIGRRLWSATLQFARGAAFRKLIIQVRGTNVPAQGFYRALGFEECGRLKRQVVLDGVEDDEILMEFFC